MKKLIASSLATIITSTSASFASTSSCETELLTLKTLQSQLATVESQLSLAKTNRNLTTVNGLGSLFLMYAALKGEGKVTGAVAVASAGALTSYNVYLSHQEALFYEQMASQVQQTISERETQIHRGQCLSDQVKQTRNEKAQRLYTALSETNLKLATEVQELNRELGNIGEKSSTIVSVGATILMVGGVTIARGKGVNASALINSLGGAAIAVVGGMLNIGSQVINLPSLKMSAKEARVLLASVQREQEKLLAQERLLKEILN